MALHSNAMLDSMRVWGALRGFKTWSGASIDIVTHFRNVRQSHKVTKPIIANIIMLNCGWPG